LQEAGFLIEQKQQNPADFYLDLGFEDLTHFYFMFKKQFGHSPSRITMKG
jgi:AraC-like DNA-binding protein